jgi:manganese-dependent inorganic pyrophosphatase
MPHPIGAQAGDKPNRATYKSRETKMFRTPIMTTLIFGHKSPDTDSTGSPLIWEWFINHQGGNSKAVLLGEPNTEAAFMLTRWGLTKPEIINSVADGQKCIIVDTNNPIMHDLMGDHVNHMPEAIKGAMLSCILSDTLEFRSPTTTPVDKALAESLAADLGLDIPAYAAEMFAAKSDVSAFSDAELLRMDSKEYAVGDTKFRVSVLETTAPQIVMDRKDSIMASMADDEIRGREILCHGGLRRYGGSARHYEP